jgi:Lrp/AsnC family leucine-responsive transcriptional regulator
VTEKIKLDKKDKKILSLLSANSRMPSTRIAKEVRLSRDAVSYRIRRMESKGLILKFFPLLDFEKLGYKEFHVFLLLEETREEQKKSFIQDLNNNLYVKNVREYSDRWDVEITIYAKTVKEFDEIITKALMKYPQLIIDRVSLEKIEKYNFDVLPIHFIEEKEIKPKKQISYKIDETDLQIIKQLSKDGRISTYKIAEKVKLSADAVGLRIKKLLAAGIIEKFTILANLSLLGYQWHTYCIDYSFLDKKEEMRLKHFIKKNPFIIYAEKTLGDYELILHIVTDTPSNFHNTIKSVRKEFAPIIKKYDTWVMYKEHFYKTLPKIVLG